MLGNIVEYRNLESGEHIQRVKGYTKILAKSSVYNIRNTISTKIR